MTRLQTLKCDGHGVAVFIPLVLFACLLFFPGCQGPLGMQDTARTGTLSLTIDGLPDGTARTILPGYKVYDFHRLVFAFAPAHGNAATAFSREFTDGDAGLGRLDIHNIPVGHWYLTVTAYLECHTYEWELKAEGEPANAINITANGPNTATVTLYPEALGYGVFEWNATFPVAVTGFTVGVYEWPGLDAVGMPIGFDEDHDYWIAAGDAPYDITVTGYVALPAGTYWVVFTLEDGNDRNTLRVGKILRVYRNMISAFTGAIPFEPATDAERATAAVNAATPRAPFTQMWYTDADTTLDQALAVVQAWVDVIVDAYATAIVTWDDAPSIDEYGLGEAPYVFNVAVTGTDATIGNTTVTVYITFWQYGVAYAGYLEAAIDAAENLLLETEIRADETAAADVPIGTWWAPQPAHYALQVAIDAATPYLGSDDQDEIDAALSALNTAIEYFTDEARTEGTYDPALTEARNALANAIEEAEELDPADYTPENWAHVDTALDAARTALAEATTAGALDAARNTLDGAIAGLAYAAYEVEAAAVAARIAVDAKPVTNTTTAGDIMDAIRAAIADRSAGIDADWLDGYGFNLSEASTGGPGTITGTVRLTLGNAYADVVVSRTIPALPVVPAEVITRTATGITVDNPVFGIGGANTANPDGTFTFTGGGGALIHTAFARFSGEGFTWDGFENVRFTFHVTNHCPDNLPPGFHMNNAINGWSPAIDHPWLNQPGINTVERATADFTAGGVSFQFNEGGAHSQDWTVRVTRIEFHGVPPADEWAIDLDAPATYTFPALTEGYTEAPPALQVTVQNTGNQPTGELSVALSGANPGAFTVTGSPIASISASETGTFTVRPNTGLAVGTHTATVTVSGGNGISESFDVSFQVNAADEPPAQGDGAITITFAQFHAMQTITAEPISLANPGTRTIQVANPGQYDHGSIAWFHMGNPVPAAAVSGEYGDGTFNETLNLNAIHGNLIGTHSVTVEVRRGGTLYSQTIRFAVTD